MIWPFLAAGVMLNALTIGVFAEDKRRAIRGEWRVSERTLLGLAAAGGSAGAIWARRRFRHKTRKQPFAALLDLIAMVHAGLLGGVAVAYLL